MIEIKVKDIDGKYLKNDSEIRKCDEDGQFIDEKTSKIRIHFAPDGSIELRAFEDELGHLIVEDGLFSQDFKIVN